MENEESRVMTRSRSKKVVKEVRSSGVVQPGTVDSKSGEEEMNMDVDDVSRVANKEATVKKILGSEVKKKKSVTKDIPFKTPIVLLKKIVQSTPP